MDDKERKNYIKLKYEKWNVPMSSRVYYVITKLTYYIGVTSHSWSKCYCFVNENITVSMQIYPL